MTPSVKALRSCVARRDAHDIGETFRDRKPCPPSMTSVHTITRKGIGVSPRLCPVAAMARAVEAPIPRGSINTHRFWTRAPTSKAIAKTRMIVMRGRVPRTLIPVQIPPPPLVLPTLWCARPAFHLRALWRATADKSFSDAKVRLRTEARAVFRRAKVRARQDSNLRTPA